MDCVNYAAYRAFCWVVHKAECTDGGTFVLKIASDAAPVQGNSLTLHTSGTLNVRCLTDDLPMVAQRTPGTVSQDLSPLRVGEFEFSAQGATRWWSASCFKDQVKLPQMDAVVMQAGESRSFPVGTKLFVCEGSASVNGTQVEGPVSLRASTQSLEIVANSNLYGLIFVCVGCPNC